MGVEEAITVYIFCGGECYADRLGISEPYDFVIAADSGMYTALEMGIVPDLFIGDFDSFDKQHLCKESREAVENIPTVSYPVKKDLTDSMIAVEIALEKGADRIIIIGALGGRLDHTLSNVFLMRPLHSKNVSAVIDNGKNAVQYIKNQSITIKKRYKYISLLAYPSDARGVSISGVEYPLEDAVLQLDNPYAVSNCITDSECIVTVKDGGLLVVESHE